MVVNLERQRGCIAVSFRYFWKRKNWKNAKTHACHNTAGQMKLVFGKFVHKKLCAPPLLYFMTFLLGWECVYKALPMSKVQSATIHISKLWNM